MKDLIMSWVTKLPYGMGYEVELARAVALLLVVIGATILYLVAKQLLLFISDKVVTKSDSQFDDVFVKWGVLRRIAYLAPAWVIYKCVPWVLQEYQTLGSLITILASVWLILLHTLLLTAILDALSEIYRSFPISQHLPIQSFIQVAKLVVYFFMFILIVSFLLGESPFKLIAGMGAMTAVLMLVFKDSILGFVAGLQLSLNKMVSLGDWVEIPQHNADGDILEIGLTTVKVRNFDNTVTTVPTQSLITESFKNWRGMQESAGRRIKRSIYIDVNSVQFCDLVSLERYSKVDYIKEYISAKKQEVDKYNQQNVSDVESMVNGRRLTNIGTFRAYIIAYLKHHPNINQQLTLLVRQLAPTDVGIPIEIYTFSSEKDWSKYEAIQADIFDHLFAVAREFDLRIYQRPSGTDIQDISNS
ncbi:MAG: mechanosensitive ion channel [Arenicellaceae bacterium]|nr:mechanosensitive ion channel [Arenicellaceae bacterium]